MATTRRAYTGGAQSTTTTSAIAASGTTSFTITAYTGWPYGTDPFFVVVEPGTASEEKILVTRTGSTDTTINIASDSERAQDGTSAVSHSSGSIVFPVFTAVDADEANELTSSWSTKGDLVSYGSSTFETLGVGSDGQFLRADSGEPSGLAWETYTNTLGAGSGNTYPWSAGEVLHATDLNAAIGVVQVVSTIKSDTFSTNPSQGTFIDVTGLSVTITPSRSANKILVLCSVNAAAGDSTTSTGDPGGVQLRVIRDSTSIGLGSGATYDATFGALSVSGLSTYDSRIPTATHYTILDSPATTSATTYKIAISGLRGPDNTVYVNRAFNDDARTSSTITALEVYA